MLTARFEGNPGREMMAAKAHRHQAEWFRRTLPPSRFKDSASLPKARRWVGNFDYQHNR